VKRTSMALGIPSPQLNQQRLYRHSTRLPSILHQFAGHFPHAPLSLMYITPVRRSFFGMRSCLSWLARQPDTSEPHATTSPASIAYVLQQLVHKLFNSNIYFSRIHSGLYISHTENLFQGSPTVSCPLWRSAGRRRVGQRFLLDTTAYS
jgi:hypothetical protein